MRRIAPTHDGRIRCSTPSADFSRPGRMWWSVPQGAVLGFEWMRYTGWPGQAPSHTVGQELWGQARDAAHAAAGPGFRLEDFRWRAPRIGSVGPDTLVRALEL